MTSMRDYLICAYSTFLRQTVCTRITNSTGNVTCTTANNSEAATGFQCDDGFYFVDNTPGVAADDCTGMCMCAHVCGYVAGEVTCKWTYTLLTEGIQ